MPNAAEIDTPEAELSSQELRETAAGLITEADAVDARAAIEAQRAARKATPGRLTARQISENIQIQMDKRRERDNKRKRDAMDRPTVNIPALEIIRKRLEPSTVEDSGPGLTGVPPHDPNIAPNVPSSAEGVPPVATTGSAAGVAGDPGFLQPETNGVESSTDSGKSGPDGSSGSDNGPGDGSSGVLEQPFLH